MARPSMQELSSMRGAQVTATDGGKIGSMDTIFLDEATGEPEWIRVESGGLFGSKAALVPVEGAQVQSGPDRVIRVPYAKEQVQGAPQFEGDEISEEDERDLYAHYGLPPTDQRSETQLPGGTTYGTGPTYGAQPETSAGGREASVTRHEEEMHVGKREAQRGRVRLRKWVETEPTAEDVSLRRETAYVEREAVDRPAPGAQLGDEEAEITLHEEEPVVGKETVEKERVNLESEEEMREETVRGEVRKEHVEVEGEADDVDEAERRRRAA